ncbi:MAG: DnaA/Hda family protein, partial [Candidatus Omnitrophota bacterium]
MPIQEIWRETLDVLETIMNRPAYEMLAKRIVPVDINGERFHIKVQGSFAGEYLDEYRGAIEDTLSSVANRRLSISVDFEEEPELEPQSDQPATHFPRLKDTVQQPQRAKTTLNDMYTFDTFVVGEGNQFCYNTSRAVAEKP